jgi:hypothetical protein
VHIIKNNDIPVRPPPEALLALGCGPAVELMQVASVIAPPLTFVEGRLPCG